MTCEPNNVVYKCYSQGDFEFELVSLHDPLKSDHGIIFRVYYIFRRTQGQNQCLANQIGILWDCTPNSQQHIPFSRELKPTMDYAIYSKR